MRLGLDIHGVISDLPEVFRFLMESIIKNGGEVHIITGGTVERAMKELSELGIFIGDHYNVVFSVMDHLIEIDSTPSGFNEKYRTPEFPDEVWDCVKANYCEQYGIDLHIDDSMIYNEHFMTPFARLYTHTGTPKPKNKPSRLLK